MAERSTLLARPSNAPTTQPTQTGAVQGSFGDYRGITALGQGLSSAGATGMDYAMNTKREIENRQKEMKKEFENRRMEDHRLETKNLVDTAMVGVKNKLHEATKDGQVLEDPVGWMGQTLADARADLTEHLKNVATDPLYHKAVPAAALEASWNQHARQFEDQAMHMDTTNRFQDRINAAEVFSRNALKLIPTGDHLTVIGAMEDAIESVEVFRIPPAAKLQLKRIITDSAYEKALGGIHMGRPINADDINNSNFNEAQQNTLRDQNAKLLDPKKVKLSDALRTFENALGDGSKVLSATDHNTALLNAGIISAAATTPEMARFPYAKIELHQALAKLTANDFALGSMAGKDMVSRLTDLTNAMSNPKLSESIYNEIGVAGAEANDKSWFKEQLRLRASQTLYLANTASNVLLDRSDELAPLASAVTAAFKQGTLTKEAAASYVEISRYAARSRGINDDIHNSMPSGIQAAIADDLRNERHGLVVERVNKAADLFGSVPLDSMANSFFRTDAPGEPGKIANPQAPRNMAFGALLKAVAFDRHGMETGRKQSTTLSSFKTVLDDLGSLAKSPQLASSGAQRVAERVIMGTSYNVSPSFQDVITGERFTATTSDIQSLKGIAQGLVWANGQRQEFGDGFKQLITNLIIARSQSAGAGTQAGDPMAEPEMLAIRAAADLNKLFSSVYTVVQGRRTLDLYPSQITDEGVLNIPTPYGANNSAQRGERIADAIKVMTYYEPRMHWIRGDGKPSLLGFDESFSNYFVRLMNSANNGGIVSLFTSGAIDRNAPFPVHATIDFAKGFNVQKAEFNLEGTATGEFRNAINKTTDRYTEVSLAYQEHGDSRYNLKTGHTELMMFPVFDKTVPGNTRLNPGKAAPLMLNYGSLEKPVLRVAGTKAIYLENYIDADRLERLNRVINSISDDGRDSIANIR